ncbi:hypothetical protein [Pseudomonas sp. PSE14]|uniref:hypothetical protein n=1 Tax=Pseudomonas sp. PSE14 TaxID=3016341 RepID=UPI0023D8A7F4|nr:hypothetical protein [Pseudomonas sp. PSE14]WEJ71956.1 hypothetical protein O6P39_25465 [Pseudomonas sp. PSE14]
MNHPTAGASAPFADATLRRFAGFRARLRLSSLIAIVLGACVLLPGTSSPLHAKEFSMKDNQGQHQPYTPGMKLPEGVFPPMQGYTHVDLIAAACGRVEALMKANDVDPTLARESLVALADHLNRALESQNAEYQIATWYQKPYDDPAGRTQSVAAMAESFGALAVHAATDSLKGSPLLHKDDQFLRSYISSAGDGVHDLIVSLNKTGS